MPDDDAHGGAHPGPPTDPDATRPPRAAARAGAPVAPAVGDAPAAFEPGSAYARYVLFVLVIVYVLNFLDRNILSILAEDIKADLGLSDAELGFLYGTAFAVFYALFGIPLGRLADVWTRRSVIAIGLGLWSTMTAASGFARGFGQLTAARIGVGIGEASASPAAFSMLSDAFPPQRRTTAIAIYSSGIYIGGGLGLMIGGGIVARWNGAWPDGGAPLGLAGWQAAFLAVGLPGVLAALWVRSLREPPRGEAEPADAVQPWRVLGRELIAVLPPLTLLNLWLATRRPAVLARNLLFAAAVAGAAALLTAVTGDVRQWGALGLGVYAAGSWVQARALDDPALVRALFGVPALRWATLGFSLLAFTGYGQAFWIPPFFRRYHGAPLEELGFVLGIVSALGGWAGVTLGGVMADRWLHRTRLARLWVGVLTATTTVPVMLALLGTTRLPVAYALALAASFTKSMWIGVGAATVQDLVPPRTRAVASAFYILMLTFVGLALGPPLIGQLSDAGGDLRSAMTLALGANGVAVACLLLAARSLVRDERAVARRAAGR